MNKRQQNKQNGKKKFELFFSEGVEQELARKILIENTSLKETIQAALKIGFTKPSESLRSITYYGQDGIDAPVKSLFAELLTAFQSGESLEACVNDACAAWQENPLSSAFNKKSIGPRFEFKNDHQKFFAGQIDINDLTFGIGPAGTGKTFIAVLKGVELLRAGAVDKLVICRPNIVAGEKLGALPGGIEDKLAPVMRPLYDELTKVLGKAQFEGLMAAGKIEIAPVETMRGRTFNKTFVILDEAQNCTEEQMKMALTRLGEDSKMVVTGDPDQCDLPKQVASGLSKVVSLLRAEDAGNGIGLVPFTSQDVVRSRAVRYLLENVFTRASNATIQNSDQPKPFAPLASIANLNQYRR